MHTNKHTHIHTYTHTHTHTYTHTHSLYNISHLTFEALSPSYQGIKTIGTVLRWEYEFLRETFFNRYIDTSYILQGNSMANIHIHQ